MIKTSLGSPPQRTCQGCRLRKNREILYRLAAVSTSFGFQVVWDRQKVLPGRGAWVCGPRCLELALKKGAIKRAFRMKVEVETVDLGLDLVCSAEVRNSSLNGQNL